MEISKFRLKDMTTSRSGTDLDRVTTVEALNIIHYQVSHH